MYSIDIDIGGTFTDGFFSDGERVETRKVLTTPHDITESFMSCVEAGSAAFGHDLGDFLRATGVARVSTTVGTNLLVQRSGPRLGLIVTAGHEKDLYAKEGKAGILDRFVAAGMVAGVGEQVDDRGRVRKKVEAEPLLEAVRGLVADGARMIGISFRNAWRNADNELRARALIRERYPVHYLRSVPLQIGTEVIHVADDHGRTNSLALNAYIHSEMARTLYRAEDRLRAAGYDRPLLVVHSSGGNARVAKTVALNTLHSGPAAAIRGAAHLARRLRLDRVVTTDMGGTSLDIAMIRGAAAPFSDEPTVEDIPLSTPMIEVESLGAGGGSIASVANGRLLVGPRSAGAAPGPACYARGGTEPTVTDANLLLGYIDPAAFMGGRMKLDAALAERAMERGVAREKGMGVENAALEVREAIDRQMALEIRRRLRAGGFDPARTALFSFGGSGPLHACAVADLLGISRVYAFPYGSVFSAFGSSTTNVRHAYARTLGIPMTQVDAADAVLDGFREQALADMRGEGFDAKAVRTAAEAVVTTGKRFKTVPVRGRRGTVAKTLEGERGRIQAVRLSAECEVPHWTPVKATARAARAPRPLGRRTVRWVAGGRLATQVYARDSLRPGHVIRGPAMVDGPDTSYAVAPGWRLAVDDYGNFVMSRAEG